jgi:anthranilate/para-aminobenzoate synthase component I
MADNKTIKFSFKNLKHQLSQWCYLNGVAIIHYVDHKNQPHTLVGHRPKKIVHQTQPSQTASILKKISQSQNAQSHWVVATSYEWGVSQQGIQTPHANAVFIEYTDVTIFNHVSETAQQFGEPLPAKKFQDAPNNSLTLVPLWTESQFANGIQQVQKCIKEGHIYQLNLSYPLSIQGDVSISDLYSRLVSYSLPLHGGFLSTSEWAIASASPEEFFYETQGAIRSRPIKGTIGRKKSLVADQLAFQTLKSSVKDHAELIMITDLIRNDLGKIAVSGSVDVTELCGIVPFSYVYHLMSTITAKLPKSMSPIQVLMEMAPGGSITGCPKQSACRHIQMIEDYPRHFYTGHMGLISNVTSFNVAIRTCYQIKQGPIMTHTGCGITIDSDPADEYQESLDKLRFLTEIMPAYSKKY